MHNAEYELPAVQKAMNSDIQHAADQAIDKGLASERGDVLDELRELTRSIRQEKAFPPGSVLNDLARIV